MSTWVRKREDRLLGGVCASIGEVHAIDPTLLRLGFLLLSLAWGLGLVLYAALWVLLPEEGAGEARGVGATARRNLATIPDRLSVSARALSSAWQRRERQRWPRPLGRRWIALALVAGGLWVMLASFGAFRWLTPARALGLAVICVGVGALFSLRRGG